MDKELAAKTRHELHVLFTHAKNIKDPYSCTCRLCLDGVKNLTLPDLVDQAMLLAREAYLVGHATAKAEAKK